MNKNVLLTYVKDGKEGFNWFNSVHDMEISIIEQGIREDEIKDKIIIHDAEEIDLSLECELCMEK